MASFLADDTASRIFPYFLIVYAIFRCIQDEYGSYHVYTCKQESFGAKIGFSDEVGPNRLYLCTKPPANIETRSMTTATLIRSQKYMVCGVYLLSPGRDAVSSAKKRGQYKKIKQKLGTPAQTQFFFISAAHRPLMDFKFLEYLVSPSVPLTP